MSFNKMLGLLLLCLGLVFSSVASATNYTFVPPSTDMQDLDHLKYLSWNINLPLSPNETVKSATLTFVNIYDYIKEDTDNLFIWLLNNHQTAGGSLVGANSYSTLYRWADNQAGGNNNLNFDGLKGELYTWNDPQGGSAFKTTLVINFDSADLVLLNQFLSDGKFAIGVDPDCHYYNDGVKLTVSTPEPSLLLLLGVGLIGIGVASRKKFKK